MGNLLTTLLSSANALGAYDQVLQVTQNNVANASTPGYARQTQELSALPFDPTTGATGGVRAGEVVSARDSFGEQSVRRQTTLMGQSQQNVDSLTSLQSLFDISGKSGLPNALNNVFQSFSAWAQTPNDAVARQAVLTNSGDVASAFQQAATGLSNSANDANSQLQQVVVHVNQLTTRLQADNKQILQGYRNDAGLQAQVYSTLEQLSQYVDFTATQQADGSMTVLLNGQRPLVAADHQFNISFQLSQPANPVNWNAPPNAQIVSSDGADITPTVTGGQLGALLDFRNRVLPSYMGDAFQPGALNTMAKQFADRVNQLLTSGNASDGPPPQPGVPLLTYNQFDDSNVAQTIAVDPSVTPDQLAAIDPGPPYASNGIALALSGLASPHDPADKVNGSSYNEFYGNMASGIGAELNNASDSLQVQQSALAQAKELRQQSSGVSLNEEATILIQFQRAYEANSKLISVLDQLTKDTIDILQ